MSSLKFWIYLDIALLALFWAALLYVKHEIEHKADKGMGGSAPHQRTDCPTWLSDSPQKGCEQ